MRSQEEDIIPTKAPKMEFFYCKFLKKKTKSYKNYHIFYIARS